MFQIQIRLQFKCYPSGFIKWGAHSLLELPIWGAAHEIHLVLNDARQNILDDTIISIDQLKEKTAYSQWLSRSSFLWAAWWWSSYRSWWPWYFWWSCYCFSWWWRWYFWWPWYFWKRGTSQQLGQGTSNRQWSCSWCFFEAITWWWQLSWCKLSWWQLIWCKW